MLRKSSSWRRQGISGRAASIRPAILRRRTTQCYTVPSRLPGHPVEHTEMEDAMGKTDYVLEPILRALKDGEKTPSSEIRQRVADSLNLSEAEREYIAPGSPYAEFKYAVAHGLVRLQSLGHLKKVSTEKIYRLTPSGAKLAASPRSLTLSDISGGSPQRSGDDAPTSSRSPERAGSRARAGPQEHRRAEADARALPGSDRPFGPLYGSPAPSWPESFWSPRGRTSSSWRRSRRSRSSVAGDTCGFAERNDCSGLARHRRRLGFLHHDTAPRQPGAVSRGQIDFGSCRQP